MFRNGFVCSWRCRIDLVADELIGVSSVWSARSGAMDYRLHAQRTYVRSDRGFKIGYNARRQSPVSLGAALANRLSAATRFRHKTSRRIVILPAVHARERKAVKRPKSPKRRGDASHSKAIAKLNHASERISREALWSAVRPRTAFGLLKRLANLSASTADQCSSASRRCHTSAAMVRASPATARTG